ncbi:MAG: hypothetical protein JRN35_06070 [Nitrososphaerota archaeon]|nr:hypothetical protein [Nitrososphaerota archaeon]
MLTTVLPQAAAQTAEGVPAWLIQTWVLSIGIIFVLAFLIWTKRHYEHVTDPSKKHPNGQIVMEVWKTTGPRERQLVDLKPNGMEIVPPFTEKGRKQKLQYFFSRSAKGWTRWPDWMPFQWLKARVPIVSWWENQSVAIDPVMDECPHCHKAVVVAKDAIPADMQEQLQETQAMVTATGVLDKAEQATDALMKMGKLNPRLVVGLLIAIAAVTALAAVFGYQAMAASQKLAGG